MTDISNTDDVIDSRDVDSRIEEIKEEIAAGREDDPDFTDLENKLRSLTALRDDVGSGEWRYGLTLINEDYFEEYCQQMVEDIGDLPSDLPSYLANSIDWGKVARQLRQDYFSVDYNGNTYLYRG